jgi:hypothetical protein
MAVEIWPVIHLVSTEPKVTIENAEIAKRCGCPGVFLISMGGYDEIIDPSASLIRDMVPGLKIGSNRLQSGPLDSVHHDMTMGYDATWSDYSWRSQIAGLTSLTGKGAHKFFAACAMKGETHNELDPEGSAQMAVRCGFIPMTSGHTTGATAPRSKIVRLRNAIGPTAPLAVSGVHPPTAHELVPLTTHWLVATAISKDFYRFDEAKLRFLKHQSEFTGGKA